MSKLTPFGIAVRKLRLEKGLRLIDMAEKLEMSTAFLSAIETGRKPIPDRLVRNISRHLEWPAHELALLTSAVDKTRKEVRVDDKKEEDRELIAVFARKKDELPESFIEEMKKLLDLKSFEGDIPFERRRKGIVVPPRSVRALRAYAEKVRSVFLPPHVVQMPIIQFIEWGLPKLDPAFVFDVKDNDEMGEDEGQVPVGGTTLILRRDVYDGACKGDGRARFTACHELAHYLLHRHITLARARSSADKIFVDSEWQADTFAGTLLMSPRHASTFCNPESMAAACLASRSAAGYMWRKYVEEGVINGPMEGDFM